MVGAVLLLAASVGYALVCFPAASRRGYPPIDYAWMGATYVWVFAVPLFTMISPPGRFSRHGLLLYALVTAYIDGCTVVGLVPHRLDLLEGIFLFPFFGPIHVAGVAVIAWLSRRVFRLLGFTGDSVTRRAVWRRGAAAAVIVCMAAGFPFGYRLAGQMWDASLGRQRADADWAAHAAGIMGSDFQAGQDAGNLNFSSRFDPDSGLPWKLDMHTGWQAAYKARVAELLRLNGIPDWSMKRRMVSEDDLTFMLVSREMTEVTTFPYDVTPNVVLMRRGTVERRWIGGFTNGSDNLEVITRNSGNLGFDSPGAAYVGRLAKYPGVVFVRCGAAWVAACSDDGWILNYASKNAP